MWLNFACSIRFQTSDRKEFQWFFIISTSVNHLMKWVSSHINLGCEWDVNKKRCFANKSVTRVTRLLCTDSLDSEITCFWLFVIEILIPVWEYALYWDWFILAGIDGNVLTYKTPSDIACTVLDYQNRQPLYNTGDIDFTEVLRISDRLIGVNSMLMVDSCSYCVDFTCIIY